MLTAFSQREVIEQAQWRARTWCCLARRNFRRCSTKAALLPSLAYHHLFVDGNKRSAVRAVTYFLALNGYDITWQFENEYQFVLNRPGTARCPRNCDMAGRLYSAAQHIMINDDHKDA